MKKLISPRLAAYGILVILSFIVIFHVLIIAGIIPYQIVWGGRLQTEAQMLQFEAVSITINLLMLVMVSLYAGLIKNNLNHRIFQMFFWAMFGLFMVNTAGNLFSKNELETLLFTPLTLLLAVFCYRLAVSNGPLKSENLSA